jgi:hypothetical protein
MSKRFEDLSPNCQQYFRMAVKDAGNWSGNPLVDGNFSLLGGLRDCGIVSHLKTDGFITTFKEQRDNKSGPWCVWIQFTEHGIAEAIRLNMEGIVEHPFDYDPSSESLVK